MLYSLNSSFFFIVFAQICLDRFISMKMPSNPPKSAVVSRRVSAAAQGQRRVQKRPALSSSGPLPEPVARYHSHAVRSNQCCSVVIQEIDASVSSVWSVVRCFDNPQAYKQFLKSCQVIVGDGNVGTVREVHVISGLPAGCSTERLEILDDEHHVMSFSVVGGDHRLANYRSVTTLHPASEGNGTVVVESYVVDIPAGNTNEETRVFVDTIVRCNLQSLAQIAENLARRSS